MSTQPEPILPPHQVVVPKPPHILSRIHRYKLLFLKRWWVLLLSIAINVCYQAYQTMQIPVTYRSQGQMMVSGRINIPEGAVYSEEMSSFLGTQMLLMQSSEVQKRARERVQAMQPDLITSSVSLSVTMSPRTAVFILSTVGSEPLYTQAFLDACMEEYMNMRKEMRMQTTDSSLLLVTEELMRIERQMRENEDELRQFQTTNNTMFLEEEAKSNNNYLQSLKDQINTLKTQYNLLERLSLDQSLDQQKKPGDKNSGSTTETEDGTLHLYGPESEYIKGKQQIQLKEAELEDLSHYLKPKHPKMVKLKEDILRLEKMIQVFKEQSLVQLGNRRDALRMQMENIENSIREQEKKVLDLNLRLSQYLSLKDKLKRNQELHEKLRSRIQTVDVGKNLDQEVMSILEPASASYPMKPVFNVSLVKGFHMGLIIGIAIILLWARLDDRITAMIDVHENFEETVVGQIPYESSCEEGLAESLIQLSDDRHVYVESFKNTRSSLKYMIIEGKPPRNIMITSSTPNEGKSMISSNIAVTFAYAGLKVLLVDADLRRGTLASAFGIENSPGLAEVLGHKAPWLDAVAETKIPNLSLLSRGSSTRRTGELILSPVTDTFLVEVAEKFDYVVFDSCPVLATDDTTSLAPKMDGVLFVIRSGQSSIRATRDSLDALYHRQVRVMGLIFNGVDLAQQEYYHYQYKEYYSRGSKRES